MVRPRTVLACAALAAALVTACSDDDSTVSVTGTPAPTTTAAATTTSTAPTTTGAAGTTTTSAPATGEPTVTVVETDLGEVLADGNGRTLYVFTRDTPGVSNCTGGCVDAWPRHAPDAAVAGEGVEQDRLGTIEVDGVSQVTIDGLPLYRFASDIRPGDVNGQGMAGNWYVVRPDGTMVQD